MINNNGIPDNGIIGNITLVNIKKTDVLVVNVYVGRMNLAKATAHLDHVRDTIGPHLAKICDTVMYNGVVHDKRCAFDFTVLRTQL